MVQPVGRDTPSLAQVWDTHVQWMNRKYFSVNEPPVTLFFPPSFVPCALPLPGWPTALGYKICTQTFPSDSIFLHQRRAVIITRQPCRLFTHEWGQKIPSDTSLCGVTFHIYFRLTRHPCQMYAGWIPADYLYIYTHTYTLRKNLKTINKLLQLKYLKFHWSTDGPH